MKGLECSMERSGPVRLTWTLDGFRFRAFSAWRETLTIATLRGVRKEIPDTCHTSCVEWLAFRV